MKNILLIGPSPPPVGGATVLFKQLRDQLEKSDDFSFIYINTSRSSTGRVRNLLSAMHVVLMILLKIRRTELVSFHSSIRGSYTLGFVVALLCRMFNKHWIFRGFGGNYPYWHARARGFEKFLFKHSVLSADIILFETKEAVNYFTALTSQRISWYPNSRCYSDLPPTKVIVEESYAKKLVFLGHVKETKGIKVLIAASRYINDDIVIDAYGPLLEGMNESDFVGSRVVYRGVLRPEDVNATLAQYDAMVFPTFYDGEGYPGVILEAYGNGLPVITTMWRTIPEIVDESCGILVEPRNIQQLAAAINELSLNADLFTKLRHGVIEKRKQFDSVNWTQQFIECCNSLS